jgi:nicotinic acid mononucleotide adenylyltransferase
LECNDNGSSKIALALVLYAARKQNSPITKVLVIEKDGVFQYTQLGSTTPLHALSPERIVSAKDGCPPPDVYLTASKLFELGQPAIVCGRTDFLRNGMVNFWGSDGQGLSDLQILFDVSLELIVEIAQYLNTRFSYDSAFHSNENLIATSIYRQNYQEQLDKLQLGHDINFPRSGNAIFLVVMSTDIPGQWKRLRTPSEPTDRALAAMQAVQISLPSLALHVPTIGNKIVQYDRTASVRHLNDLLTTSELQQLTEALRKHTWRSSDVHGKPVTSMDAGGGSLRTSIYNTSFADSLWLRLKPLLPPTEIFHSTHALTDTSGCQAWYPTGVSPLLRFMMYDAQKSLVVHYDAPYVESDDTSTLYTLVVYLNTNKSGGTRFYTDRQRNIPHSERNYTDQKICEEQVLKEFLPTAGEAIVFPHRLLHDSAPLQDGMKLILRTDIIYRKCTSMEEISYAKHIISGPNVPMISILDHHYFSARDRYTPEQLVEAGYLSVRRQEPLETNWLSTPFGKAVRNLEDLSPDQKRAPLVLFSTGCYNPPHAGHFHILQKAKTALEERGHTVIAGYVVPAHQSYINQKVTDCPGQHASLSASRRLAACGGAISNDDNVSTWLDVDPYEVLYGRCDVNFTATQHRLELYLRQHVSDQVHLVYVFGGDNASFTRVYWNRGLAVCVNRPGYEDTFERFRAELESDAEAGNEDRKKRILWVKGYNELASSIIRCGKPSSPTKVTHLAEGTSSSSVKSTYYLRLESKEHRPFTLLLASLIEASIPSCMVCLTEIRDQIKLLATTVKATKDALGKQDMKLQSNHHIETISLDAAIPGKYNLAISRLYLLCDIAQATRLSSPTLTHRPGSADIPSQLARIPSGPNAPSYILFDDDIYTGNTMRRATSLLTTPSLSSSDPREDPARVIISTLSLTPTMPRPIEIADARDFLVGTSHGGLVVRLPSGQLARAPYVLPYVSPNARASIPLGGEVEFSREVWRLNLAHYESVKGPDGVTGVTVGGVDFWAGALLRYIGFRDEDEMVVVCKWHLRRFM